MDALSVRVVSSVIGVLVLSYLFFRRSNGRSFPGPIGLPIIGNALQIPAKDQWLTYAAWSKKWGSLVKLKMFGKHILVVNDVKDAVELLVNRSKIYSGRPRRPGAPLTTIAQHPYDSTLRARRKLLHQVLNPRILPQYWTTERRETVLYLQRLLEHPQNFVSHIRRAIGSTIIGITYGYPVQTQNDPWIELAEEHNRCFSIIQQSGSHWSDSFPFLTNFPTWIPGVKFRRMVQYAGGLSRRMKGGLYDYVKKSMADGTARPSIMSILLDELEASPNKDDEHETNIKVSGGALFSAGTDTTLSVLTTFILTMTLNPTIQVRAQAELDSVTGHAERLPTFEDRDKLPYVGAIIKECFRWGAILPLGLAHESTEDDVYLGKWIEAGTTILPNIWKFLHEPAVYSQPERFLPERFLSTTDASQSAPPDPRDYAFGFGRRICPGKDLANDIMFILVASTLAVFDIRPLTTTNEKGEKVETAPEVEYTGGMLIHPKPFECSITPRSEDALMFIKQSGAPLG